MRKYVLAGISALAFVFTASTAGAAANPLPLPSSFPIPTKPCSVPAGGTMIVTVDCLDPALASPYIDADRSQTTKDPVSKVSVTYRYIHGGFTGTDARFVFYFPAPDKYQGRFFQGTYPTIAEEAAGPSDIVFAISHGAYVVSTNNDGGVAASPTLGGYRTNAAAAKLSRQVAAAIYGDQASVRGYLFGASGGAYQTIGGIEATTGVWDGAVPMVPGTPNAIPSNQAAMLLGLRVLHDKFPSIVDAEEPGGSGDPYAGLSTEQKAILKEVSTLGFPVRGWWQYANLDGGSFWAVAGGVRTVDPTYVDDFWNTQGYEGANPASSVRAARVQGDATVATVSADKITLSGVPGGDLTGADLTPTSGAAAGKTAEFVTVKGSDVTFDHSDPKAVTGIAVGDHVKLDNSWYLALQYYPRYQVPTPDMYAWNQYRDASGNPIYPQRSSLAGKLFSTVSGGYATGRFQGKMIVLASTMDVEAFGWSADWYQKKVQEALGAKTDDDFRLWYQDNTDHSPPKSTAANAHVVTYDGERQQALLDLDAWVAKGIAPPASTAHTVSSESAVELPADATACGGVQPLVTLGVGAGAKCDASTRAVQVAVAGGKAVGLSATAQVPPGAGKIVRVEWDFDSSGKYPVQSKLTKPAARVQLCQTHKYARPGTYFAVVRVTSNRTGDPKATVGLIQNLARVRVVVK